jgi:hypothetical protein
MKCLIERDELNFGNVVLTDLRLNSYPPSKSEESHLKDSCSGECSPKEGKGECDGRATMN